MSKKIGYADVSLVKSRAKKNGIITFFVFTLAIAFVVLLAGVLSGAISVGNFKGLFFKDQNSISTHSYHMVYMAKCDTKSKAESVASGAQVVGAGAYVWELDGEFYVVGSIYKTKEEASAVYNNIKNTGNYEIGVKELNFKKLEVNEKNYSTEQTKSILSAIKSLDEIYDKCFKFSVMVDKGEVNPSFISSELNTIKSEAKVIAAKLDALNSYAASKVSVSTKNAFVFVVDAIDNAVLRTIGGKSANSDLKYLIAKIIAAKYNLYQNI